jgi:hemerythrin-like domain-containing protein
MAMESINDCMTRDHAACDASLERAADAAHSADWPALQREAGAFLAHIARHIELEEDLLFPAFEQSTGMSSGGPTETMRSEHVQMQPLFAQMRDAATAKDAAGYLGAAQAMQEILQLHNMKEEQMMYPMLDQSLGAQAAAAMVDECRRALDALA